MPQSRTYDRNGLMRLVRWVAAWVALLILLWIALGYYGQYRTAVRDAKKSPETSVVATTSPEATATAPSGEGSKVAEPASPSVLVLADGLNFREKPLTSSNVIKKLKKGTSLELLETAGGWYRVKDPEGVEGWVAAGGNYTQLVK